MANASGRFCADILSSPSCSLCDGRSKNCEQMTSSRDLSVLFYFIFFTFLRCIRCSSRQRMQNIRFNTAYLYVYLYIVRRVWFAAKIIYNVEFRMKSPRERYGDSNVVGHDTRNISGAQNVFKNPAIYYIVLNPLRWLSAAKS